MKTKRFALITLGFAAAAALAGCQTRTDDTMAGELRFAANDGAIPALERIMQQASVCWFKQNASGFANYRIAPEINAISGPPRILLVPASNPAGRPKAVIEAQGNPATIDVYGPLMTTGVADRIAADTQRWAAGGTGCGAAA
ncbi:hypothetical protein [Pararhizobium mangrovi]|uniref:Lipoprotein n=1 Tax=Pararhizobium mangrovi TaxID=2590452 RepID=A0A506U4J1_9HYPH|nr:hypothetical protein [Pararhizobium mangrovi]TPW26797.1 hypothetical protein FJU11_13395 [Pararhizobium mangrovi]